MTITNIRWPNSIAVLSFSEYFDKVFSDLDNKDLDRYSQASHDTYRQCENFFRQSWELLKRASISSLSPSKIDYHFKKIEDSVNVHFPENPSFYAKCRKLTKVFRESQSRGRGVLEICEATLLGRYNIIPNNTVLSTALPISKFEEIDKETHDRALEAIWPMLRYEISESLKTGSVFRLHPWAKGREILIGLFNELDVILPSKDTQEETVRSFFNDPVNISLIKNAISQFPSTLPPINASAEEIRRFLSNPETEFLLEKINILQLNNLCLNRLPPELVRLKNLRQLELSYNFLNDFPDLHFKELRMLTLNGNDLTEILSINHLPKLENLIFDLSASMFVSDEIFLKFPNLIEHFSYSNGVFLRSSTYLSSSEELKYRCESSLALLWQSIFKKDSSIEEMKLIVTGGLTPEDRNLIYKMVWEIGGRIINSDPQWGEHHAFDSGKMFRFALAVGGAILTKLESLSQEQKNQVYGHIYELAGRPETAHPQWGERCATTAPLARLADALARIEQ